MIDQYPPANGVLTSLIWRKTMSGGETSLSGYDNASQALSYTPGQEQVYLNGILLVRGDDYTATNGTSITGLSALAANDFVQVNCYNNFSVATLPTSGLTGTISNAQLQNSSITINGSAVSLGGSTTIAGGSAQDDAPTSPTEGQLWLDTNGTLATTGFVEKSTINAKGDLYVGTADNTVGILSTTESGATLVADSSATTGLRWQGNFAAGKNKIINGDFGIWQRGTSKTVTADDYYAPDRFLSTYVGGGATVTWSQQTFTPGTAPVTGYEGTFFSRLSATSGSGTTVMGLSQKVEDVRTFANQTATFSFWAKADSARLATILIFQEFGSGGSTTVTALNTTQTLSTSWTRYSFTVAMPSVSGKTIGAGSNVRCYVYYNTGSASGSPQLDTWGWQLEAGNTATAFQTATGTLAGELAACQRYYWRVNGDSANDMYIGFGSLSSTTNARIGISPNTTMRTKPTVIDVNDVRIYRDATTVTPSAVAISAGDGNNVTVNATIASGTSGVVAYIMLNNSSGAYIGLGAEL